MTAKLNNEQKMMLQQRMHDYESSHEFVDDMSKELKVAKKVITEYMFSELAHSVLRTEAEAQQQEKQAELVPEETKELTKNKLVKAGLRADHAQEIIDRITPKIEVQLSADNDGAQRLYEACLANLSSFDAMQRKSTNGREGIVIMTDAASTLSDDELKKNRSVVSRSARGALYGTDGKKAK